METSETSETLYFNSCGIKGLQADAAGVASVAIEKCGFSPYWVLCTRLAGTCAGHKGVFACFFGGLVSRLVSRAQRRALARGKSATPSVSRCPHAGE